jgi:DnaK suppressor protein
LPSKSKLEHFKLVLETHVAEAERIIENAEQEVRASSVKHADAADQAAAEYERQASTFKANAARQTLRSLGQALDRICQGTFGECVQCGSEEVWRLLFALLIAFSLEQITALGGIVGRSRNLRPERSFLHSVECVSWLA